MHIRSGVLNAIAFDETYLIPLTACLKLVIKMCERKSEQICDNSDENMYIPLTI